MATGKKSVLLYCDLIHTIEKMDDKTAGEFFKHYLRYINDLEPETTNPLIDITFESVKQNLKRDLIKWEGKQQQRSDAGKKSAELRRIAKEEEQRNATTVESRSTNPTVTGTVTGNVTVTDKVNVKDTLKDREWEFNNSLLPFLDNYSPELIKKFSEYWTEHNENGKKMRFEYSKNQPFSLKRRLITWSNRQQDFQKEKSSGKKEKTLITNR
tara:strand:- start:1602 stop:2237 length:636 start_codon:yes stop_codon:yes gene_type:complete